MALATLITNIISKSRSIVGVGSAGVICRKGLRVANGESNVIVQNVNITDLSPEYIWGRDAITLAGTGLIWIDHCKFSYRMSNACHRLRPSWPSGQLPAIAITTPITAASATGGGKIFNAPSSPRTSNFSASLGRSCVVNSVSNSGTFSSCITTNFLTNLVGKNVQPAVAVSGIAASVTSKAGVGKIGN